MRSQNKNITGRAGAIEPEPADTDVNTSSTVDSVQNISSKNIYIYIRKKKTKKTTLYPQVIGCLINALITLNNTENDQVKAELAHRSP